MLLHVLDTQIVRVVMIVHKISTMAIFRMKIRDTWSRFIALNFIEAHRINMLPNTPARKLEIREI